MKPVLSMEDRKIWMDFLQDLIFDAKNPNDVDLLVQLVTAMQQSPALHMHDSVPGAESIGQRGV
ncbi:MAG: hypothetical protein WBP79_13120 [Candidatus Acidiferrales bacterium]